MSVKNYRQAIRAAVRGFWGGALTRKQFTSTMESAIRRGIQQAWAEGASEGGITPDEYTNKEKAALSKFIIGQLDYVGGFADAIAENNKASKGKVAPLLDRAEKWINRYNEARHQAASMAAADKKKIWRLGDTKSHCRSCKGFNGRVYRYSVWAKNGALPQSGNLSCSGMECHCGLEDTNRPITRGKFPTRLLKEVDYGLVTSPKFVT